MATLLLPEEHLQALERNADEAVTLAARLQNDFPLLAWSADPFTVEEVQALPLEDREVAVETLGVKARVEISGKELQIRAWVPRICLTDDGAGALHTIKNNIASSLAEAILNWQPEE